MKRDARLHGLTSDHHHALVLALRIKEAAEGRRVDAELAREVRRRYESQLLPHFLIEEEELLPALVASRPDLVERTLREHRLLRDHIDSAEAGDLSRLEAFGTLLKAHVRFEEGELFDACETDAGDEALARVALRAPKPGRRPAGDPGD